MHNIYNKTQTWFPVKKDYAVHGETNMNIPKHATTHPTHHIPFIIARQLNQAFCMHTTSFVKKIASRTITPFEEKYSQ